MNQKASPAFGAKAEYSHDGGEVKHPLSGYFQFPLSLLSYGENEKTRLHDIVSFCVAEQAKGNSLKALRASAKFLNVNLGTFEGTRARWEMARGFVRARESLYGRDPFVRIAASLLWQCEKGQFSYRDFCILCAINSAIGAKRYPVRLTEPSIRVRAAGFKSWKVFQSIVPVQEQKSRLLSNSQVRYTVECLHRRKFYGRINCGGRIVKFHNRMTDEQLREMEINRATSGCKFRSNCRKKDVEMQNRIKALKAMNVEKDLSQKPPKGNNNGISNINNSVLNNSLSNKSEANKTDVLGYLIGKNFLPQHRANQWAVDNPSLLERVKAVPAVKRGDLIIPQNLPAD